MTFDDDFIALQFDHGVVRQPCRALGLDWPPPEKLNVMGLSFERQRYSSISDEDRGQMTHVCRGAEYYLAERAQEGKK